MLRWSVPAMAQSTLLQIELETLRHLAAARGDTKRGAGSGERPAGVPGTGGGTSAAKPRRPRPSAGTGATAVPDPDEQSRIDPGFPNEQGLGLGGDQRGG